MNHRAMVERVGILGGMGPAATLAFYREVIWAVDAEADQGHVPVILDADPRTPDRSAYLLGAGPDPRPWMVAGARRLAAAGAELVVIPCNTANLFAEYVAEGAGVAVFPWFRTAVAAAAERLGRIDGPRAVGLLATTGTVAAGVYQRELAARGLEWRLPDELGQRELMGLIYGEQGVKRGPLAVDASSRLLELCASLASAGAGAVLLGCTELPLIVDSRDERWPVPAVDPAVSVATAVVVATGRPVRAGGLEPTFLCGSFVAEREGIRTEDQALAPE